MINGLKRVLVSKLLKYSGVNQRCFAGPGRSGMGRGTHFRWDGGTSVPFYPRDAGRKIGFGMRPETSLVPTYKGPFWLKMAEFPLYGQPSLVCVLLKLLKNDEIQLHIKFTFYFLKCQRTKDALHMYVR